MSKTYYNENLYIYIVPQYDGEVKRQISGMRIFLVGKIQQTTY